MAEWTVVEVIDGDTFRVTPDWQWHGQSGDCVRPVGYNAPEVGTEGALQAADKLAGLILGKSVVLGNAFAIDRGRLVCHVFVGGADLASHFPEDK